MDILKYLIYAIILSYPFGELSRFSIFNNISITMTDLLVIVAGLSWIVHIKKFSLRLLSDLQKHILIFIIALAFSLLINLWRYQSSEIFVGIMYLVRWVFYCSLFFIVRNIDEITKSRLISLMIFVGSLFSFFGLIQYALYPDLRNLMYLGWDDHLFRLFSTVFDPNFAAVMINLYIFLIAGILISKSNKKYIYLYTFLFFLGFIALLLTYSRSGYLMFLVGMMTMLILSKKKKIALLLVAVFLSSTIFLPKSLPSEGVNLFRSASVTSRIESMDHAILIIKDNPLFGVGFNMYRFAQDRYGFATKSKFTETHSAAGTDNSFLFILATTGVIGFTVYILMWGKIITASLKNYVFLGSAVGLFVNAVFVNSLFYPFVMLWMWILLGLMERN